MKPILEEALHKRHQDGPVVKRVIGLFHKHYPCYVFSINYISFKNLNVISIVVGKKFR